MQQLLAMVTGLQQRTDQMVAEHATREQNLNQQLTLAADRVVDLEGQMTTANQSLAQLSAVNATLADERRSSMDVIRAIPAALEKLADSQRSGGRRALMDNKGLGKPYALTDDDTDSKFRMWAIKVEDFVCGIFGEKFRELMQWSAEQEEPINESDTDAHGNSLPGDRLSCAFGDFADGTDQYEDLDQHNPQLYAALRSLTEGTPFTYVDNAESGNGLEAWRALHAKYDPATGGRKKAMLNALIRPNRATYEHLAGALERWKTLKTRYDHKKDQFGRRERLPESIAMNAMEQLVPKDLEDHLLLNQSRLKTFVSYEAEIKNYVEAKHGGKIKITADFSKDDGGVQPMDVSALVAAVSGHSLKDIAAFVKGKGKGKGGKGAGGKGKGKGKGDDSCFNCGRKGHQKKDCRQPGGGAHRPGGKGGHGDKPTCKNCGKTGHKADDCWQKAGKGGSKNSGKKGDGKKGGGKKNLRSWENAEDGNQEETQETGEELCSFEKVRGLASLERVSGPDPAPTPTPTRTTTTTATTSRTSDLGGFDGDNGEWIKCNFDTGAADTAIPRKYKTGPAVETGTTFRTASGELVPGYGSGALRGGDENGKMRNINGEFTDVHKVLVAASAVHQKGHFSWLEAGGGYVIDKKSPAGKELQAAFQKVMQKYGSNGMLPIWEENGVYNFYLRKVQATPATSSSSTSNYAAMDVSANDQADGTSSAPGESRHAQTR